MDKQEKANHKSQWYSTDKLDTNVDFQDWQDNGVTTTADYEKAYDEMMKEKQPNGKQK